VVLREAVSAAKIGECDREHELVESVSRAFPGTYVGFKVLSPYAGAAFRAARVNSGYWFRLFNSRLFSGGIADLGIQFVQRGRPFLQRVERMLPFNADNFRYNLAALWDIDPPPFGYDAHHVFPQALETRFRAKGVDIHDPAFGAWWEESSHRAVTQEYNQLWDRWLLGNPDASLDEMIDYGRELADDYGFHWGY